MDSLVRDLDLATGHLEGEGSLEKLLSSVGSEKAEVSELVLQYAQGLPLNVERPGVSEVDWSFWSTEESEGW